MTRREQIEELVSRYADKPDIQPYIRMAAEWADANPKEPDTVVLRDRVLNNLKDQLAIALEAIKKVHDDEETGEGWGPDVTMKAVLANALQKIQELG